MKNSFGSNSELSNNINIKTEIPVLDKLLGFSEVKSNNSSLERSGIMILRGEPGSGKTTLGLQILSNNILKLQFLSPDQKKNAPRFYFISLEGDPYDIVQYSKSCFSFFENDTILKPESLISLLSENRKSFLTCIGVKEISEFLHKIAPNQRLKYKMLDDLLKDLRTLPIPGIKMITFLASLVSSIGERRSNNDFKVEEKIKMQNFSTDKSSQSVPFIFIDSLNVFVQLLKKEGFGKDIPERLFLSIICDTLRNIFNDSILILSSEYHYSDSKWQSTASESFYSDIEVALFSEPIVASPNYLPKFESPVGNNILSLATEQLTSIQSQSFCRVLKSRKTPNQTRRCAYDIEMGKGVVFFETYPGDGQAVLFAENAKQEQIWNEFFKQDLPLLYPALRTDNFDRRSLQRTSAAQRRFRYVPQRIDMYLTSFDNYWLNWYSELCLKSNVTSSFKQVLGDINFPAIENIDYLINQICAILSKRQEFTSLQQKIYNHEISVEILKNFFDSILKNKKLNVPILLKEKIKNMEKRNWGRILRKDEFNVFMSELYDILLKQKFIKNSNSDLEEHPQCLQCLWNRSLALQLHKSLDNKFLSTTYMDDFFINFPSGSNIANYLTEIADAIENDLPIQHVVHHTLINIMKCRTAVCPLDIQMHDNNKVSYVEFLELKESPCMWKQDIKDHLHRFFASWFYRESSHGNCKESEYQDIITDVLAHVRLNDEQEDQSYIQRFSDVSERAKIEILLSFLRSSEAEELGDFIINEINEKIFVLMSDEVVTVCNNLAKDTSLKSLPKEFHFDDWIGLCARTIYDAVYGKVNYELVTPLPNTNLRLFGERRANIIPELEEHRLDSSRPVHRPNLLFALKDRSYYSSIPYDANISFLVFRKDLLNPFFEEMSDVKNVHRKKEYIDTIVNIIQSQEKAFENILFPKAYRSQFDHNAIEMKVTELVEANIKNKKPPKTWEEIIAYYLIKKEESESKFHFLIETQTSDTILSTMLEFIWSCGANLRVSADYKIEAKETNIFGIYRAFYLLSLMFQYEIIPVNSSVDAMEFSSSYSYPKEGGNKGKLNWIFARHWYSTFTEILSSTKTLAGNSLDAGSKFLWQHDGVILDIMPIPVSFSNYLKYGDDVWHISCWGDWHLAILHGTENLELGCDLINNIMSSDRVCERASANAAVPTLDLFYDQYGDTCCFNHPERKDIKLPETTYNQLRTDYFKHAKSRSQIYDYHHCMREFHAVLEFIHFAERFPKPNKDTTLDPNFQKELFAKLNTALDNIEGFGNRHFLQT
ncbi:MAG: hypothetical protein H6696_06900 [Deferribacteres bacterium]|nr:hypothetical protein [Deferribacteres bacterium]